MSHCRKRSRRATAALAATSALLIAPPVPAAPPATDEGVVPIGQHHDGTAGHLPPAQENMPVVSKLELTKAFGDVQPEQIADVTVHNGFAYLSSWHIKRADEQQCRGGFYIVDIRDPAKPVEIGFQRALAGSYHTEGMHALAVKTPHFTGDLLAISNEHQATFTTGFQCRGTKETQGGFDLWDVSDPANPKPLVRGFGDMGAEETAQNTPNMPAEDRHQMSNQYHSAFVWQDGNNLFLVAVDNNEDTQPGQARDPNLGDVDVFDITNPRQPVQIGDFDLDVMFPQISSGLGYAGNQFLHDMVVKEINGVQTMLASYWDGGYVALNVEDPANPRYIADSDFSGPDPVVPNVAEQPGDAHYAEFSHDGKFILAADEDFTPYRVVPEITSGEFAGERFAASTATEARGQLEPGQEFAGPTEFIGQACDAASIPAPPTADTIAVAERGGCSFQLKTENASAKGYRLVIIMNSNSTSSGCEDLVNMAFTNYQGDAKALFVARSVGLKILGTYDEATYQCVPGGAMTPAPALGHDGASVEISNFFDGWGYTHLYRYQNGKLPQVDAFAIPEAVDTRFFAGFGDLSVHEWATDPTEYLAYSAYYSGGMRVFTFGDQGLGQVGAYIDPEGSNFWGVEQFTGSDGHRYIAGSDRDFGLYIFRYTGPGAAMPPTCNDVAAHTQQDTAATIQLTCTDPNPANRLQVRIDRQPANGTLSAVTDFKVTYTPRSGFRGVDTFTYRAFDGAALSRIAQVQVFVGRCARRFDGTGARDLLNGTPGGDAFFAAGGNDVVDGLQGDDCLAGEDGNDELSGGLDDDSLGGGAGRDRMFGESGDDQARGGAGNDHIRGSSGDDEVYGEDGNDFVSGGSNSDRVSGGRGRDSVRGEAGDDRLFGGAGNDRINTGPGNHRVSGGPGNDRISAANGQRDRIRCGRGSDRVRADRQDRVAGDCETVSRLRRRR